MKIGEMEESKFLCFCRIQNLRILFDESRLPPELLDIVSLYEKRFQISVHGTFIDDCGVKEGVISDIIKVKDRTKMSPDDNFYIKTLHQWISTHSGKTDKKTVSKAKILAHIDINGKRYQSSNRDGRVVFQVFKEGVCSYLPGHIISIISLQDKDDAIPSTYALLRRYEQLSEDDVASDYYRKLSHCGYLVYNNLTTDDYTVAPISDIITHFAFTEREVPGITRECLHILPL